MTLIGHEIRASGERYIYGQADGDAFYAVGRPREWTAEEEAQYVADMRAHRLGRSAQSRLGA